MTHDNPQTEITPQIIYTVMTDEELDRPYKVIILNDDITPMEFVVIVLRSFFELTIDRAYAVMLEAHHEGHAYVASYPFEEAQERVYQAHSVARENGYPLTFYLEPDE